MKMNWGFGIGAVYIFFVVATLIMVYIFMNQEVPLETNDYYEKGINYQKQIDKIENTKSLSESLDISMSGNFLELKFPKIFSPNNINGQIQFYRPSNVSKDFVVGIAADSSNRQQINTSKMEKGLWKLKIEWQGGKTSYYNEKVIMVN